MSDMRMPVSQQFAQCTPTAALCQWVCGEAPTAWCWAKGSSGQMWVAPAATGLRFIYLGTEASTQETQQDLALEAADIIGKIKLLCHISNLKWKLDPLHSHAFTLTLFPVSVLAFTRFLVRLPSVIVSREIHFQCLKVITVLNGIPVLTLQSTNEKNF